MLVQCCEAMVHCDSHTAYSLVKTYSTNLKRSLLGNLHPLEIYFSCQPHSLELSQILPRTRRYDCFRCLLETHVPTLGENRAI